MTLARMAIAGSTEAGYLTATGGTMTYCQSSETVAWMELGLSNTLSGAKEIAIPIKPNAEGGFRPDMRYTCSPNYLQIDIKLPPPINNVQYRLGNVGAEAFGEYYSAEVRNRLRLGPSATEFDPLEITPVTPEEVPLDITPVEPVEVSIPNP